jgi:hypothetical protein
MSFERAISRGRDHGRQAAQAPEQPASTPADRAHQATIAFDRGTQDVRAALDEVSAARSANNPERWGAARIALDAALKTAKRAGERAGAQGHDATPEVKALFDASVERLGELDREAVTMAEAPSGLTAISREAEIKAILAEPIEGSSAAGYDRKEAALRAELDSLDASECRTLAQRLRRARANDSLAVMFGRLTADRRQRLLAFLDGARKRDAMRGRRATAAKQEEARKLVVRAAVALSLPTAPVRLDDHARERTEALGTNAAMSGGEVLLHPERFDPHGAEALETVAHELVHVAQLGVDGEHGDAEGEAHRIAEQVAAGKQADVPRIKLSGEAGFGEKKPTKPVEPKKPEPSAEDLARREQMLGSLSLVTARWKAIGGTLFTPAELPEAQLPETFKTAAYELIVVDQRDVEPVGLALAGPGREKHAMAFEVARRTFLADRPHLAKIDGDIKYLASGGDLQFSATRLVASHAVASPLAKNAIRTIGSLALGPLWDYLSREATEHGTRIRRSQLEAEGHVPEYVIMCSGAGGVERRDGCYALFKTLQAGAPVAPAPADAPKDAPAIVEEAKGLGNAIKFAVGKANKAGIIPIERLQSLDKLLAKATPRARELVFANEAVMGELARKLAPDQATALLAKLDTVEDLYQQIKPSLPLASKVPTVFNGVKVPLPKLDINNTSYPALRAWLEARAGDQGVRTRVLQHGRLKTDVIDRLVLEQQRLIYRLVARGTVVANSEDKAFEAAELGRGADLVRAMRDLAGTDPKRFAELERDSLFRRAVEKMTKPVSVDGVMLKPWDVCQTMWGRSPGTAADPLVGGVSQVNLTGNDLPLTADERHTLDEKLFNPTLEIIRAQVFYKPKNAWDLKPLPRAQKVLDCLREFERIAAEVTIRDLLQRDRVVAGVALAQRFERRYGVDLRTWIYESGGPNIRSGVARILGTEQGASVGNFNGEVVTLGEAKPGKATLQQALRETLSGGWTMSEWCSVESRQLARGINSGDKGDVLAAWRRFEPHARASADDIQTATGMHIRPIDLMRNAHLEHSGNLETNLAAKFNATDRAELEKELGIDVANATDAQQKAKLEPEALAEQKFGAPAKILWMAIQRLGPESDAMEHAALGGLLMLDYLLPRADGTPGTRVDGTHEEQPVISFGGYYRKHYGTSPDDHVTARLRAMTGSRTVSLDAAGKMLGIDVARIAKPPVATGELVIDERNEHLVRGEFTVEVAKRRAKQIWQIIHEHGRLELINNLLYGDCNDEEQRLIRIAFRELSGGFDLVFYIRQAIDARQERAGSTERSAFGSISNVVAPAANLLMPTLDDQKLEVGAGDSAVHIHGTATELERALALSSSGEIDLMTRLRTAAGRSDSDQVFRILEDATPDQHKAILADGVTVDKLRRLGQWQWERCFKTLTGQSDLADRFYSRSHGDGSWSERNFGGTHEAGMEEDIKIYIRKLRVKIDREVRAEVAAMPNKPSAAQIDDVIRRRLLAACGEAAANKSVQAIMRSELEVDELRKMDTQIVNAGTADEWAVAGNGGSKEILSEIRGLGADERARRLKDPQYLRVLGSQLGEKDYREALNALSTAGDADISHAGGALARLDAASRTGAQVEGAESDARKTLRALSELSPDEYKRLLADPKLQIQVLNALSESERVLAREMLGFEFGKPEVAPTDPEAMKAAAEAAAVKRAEFFVHQSIGRLRAGALRAWRDLLVQSVEVFKLDFVAGFVKHNEGGHRKRGGDSEDAPKLDTVALRAKIWDGVSSDVHAFGREHRLHPQKKTKDSITAFDMKETVRKAVEGTADPSEALIRENIYTVDEKLAGQSDAEAAVLKVYGSAMDHSVDATGLADTLKSASDQHVVEHWTSVLLPPAGGGDTMAIRYAELKAAEAASDKKNPSVPLASVPTATDEVTPAPEPEIHGKSERVDDPALRAAIKARRRFIEYSINIAQALEKLLVPYMGDDRSTTQAVEGERLAGRDNKRYNDLSKIIYERIPRLPHEQIGKSLKIEDKHTWLLSGEARRHVGEVNARKQRYLRYRGEQDNNNSSAQDEKEILDEEQSLLGREHANAIQDGVVTGGEKERYEQRYEAVDRAQEAHQTAKETAAGWAALIVGVVLTIVVTVLTGGLATGPVAMLALAGATAALSATAKSLVMEQILDGEWDNKDAADMISKEVITGIVTAGTTFYAQKLLAAAAGMTKLAKQGAAVKQVLRTPPKLYQALAREAAEEATSEAMSSVIDAGMAAIDPAHWMHGYQEGAHEAKQAAFAELAKTGSRVKEAALTSVFTSLGGRALGKLRRGGSNAKPERDRSLEVPASAKKRVDVVRNLKQVLGDPGDKFMEALIQWGMQQDGAINWANAPQELLRGWIEEMGEAGTEMHTGTVHKHQRETKAKADLARSKDKLSTDEKADFNAMQDGALDTDVYVSVDDYTRIREHVIERGLDATEVRTGKKLTPAQRKAFVAWARTAKTAEELATFAHTDPATRPDVMAAGTAPTAPTAPTPTAPMGRTTQPLPTVAPTPTETPVHARPTQQRPAVDPTPVHERPTQQRPAVDPTPVHARTTQPMQVAQPHVLTGPRPVFDDLPQVQQLAPTMPEVLFGSHQQSRVEPKLQALSDADYQTFRGLVAAQTNPVAQSFLFKALAANNSMADIAWLAGEIATADANWLVDNLTLGDPRGVGGGIQQQWISSCSAATTLTVRGNYDPVFALKLRYRNTNVGGVDDANPDAMNMHQADLEKDMLESEYTGQRMEHHGTAGAANPRAAGGGIGRRADDLLDDLAATTGVSYASRNVAVPTDAVPHLDTALAQGMQVPVVVGNGTRSDAHYLLAMARREGANGVEYQFHDVWFGRTGWVSAADLASGRMPFGWGPITGVEVPTVGYAPAPASMSGGLPRGADDQEKTKPQWQQATAQGEALDAAKAGTANRQQRDLLANELKRQVPYLALSAAVENDGARTVISVVTPGGGETGIKTMNDDVLGYSGTNQLLAERNKVMAEVFAKHGMTVVQADYKTSTIVSTKSPTELAGAMRDALTELDAAMRSRLQDALLAGQVHWQSKLQDGSEIVRKDAAKRLANIGKLLAKLDSDPSFGFQVHLGAAEISGGSTASYAQVVSAAMNASKAAIMARSAGVDRTGADIGHERGLIFSAEHFKKFAEETVAIRDRLATMTLPWNGKQRTIVRPDGRLDPDLARAARKKEIDRSSFTKDPNDKDPNDALDLLDDYMARINAADHMTSSLAREVTSDDARVTDAKKLLSTLESDQAIDAATASGVENELTRGTPQSGTANEAQFFARAGASQDRVVLNADIIDLGIDVINANAEAIGRIAGGDNIDTVSLGASDAVIEIKRDAVAEFEEYYEQLLPKARALAVERGRPDLVAILDNEKSPLVLLGGDEVTVSLPRAFEELGLIPQIVTQLQNVARARVAVTHTGPTETGERGHDQAMEASESPHKLLKENEKLARTLEDVASRMPEGKRGLAERLARTLAELYTTDEGGQVVVRDREGKPVDLEKLHKRANRLIRRAKAYE